MNINQKLPTDERAEQTYQIWRKWSDARADWDKKARQDIDFYLGNHFSSDEVTELEERNQSSLTLDRLYSAIEQFKAIITSKPPKFSAVGREDSDTKLANVWKTILEYIWDLSDGNETFKQVIHDYAVCGVGYFYGYIDRDADYGRGEVKFTYVDPFRVYVDPNSRNRWYDDASGMILSTILTKDQLVDYYAQMSEPIDEEGTLLIDVIEAGTQFKDEDYPSSDNASTVGAFTPDMIKDADFGRKGAEKYRVLEHFTKTRVPYFRLIDNRSGQETIMDVGQFEQFINTPDAQKALEMKLVDYVQIFQTRIKVVCTIGQIVLYETILDTDIYPITPVPNIWTNTPYPMSDVRKGKDMQRLINKLLSLITSHAQSSAGLKLLIPYGSVTDIEKLEQDWANPNATIEYDPSFGEPHFPAPQPMSGSILQLPQMIEHYIDLNMGIFEMQQGNAEAAPRTSSGTMMMEDFGQRRSKSKLRDIEGSIKRLGRTMYNLAKSHYTYQKTFRIVQPNNDINEFTVNMRLVDDKSQTLQTIQNDISSGQFDIRVIGNSTMPSNKWGEWQVYMEAYQAGLIDKTEALKKTEIFDKEGVLQRTSEIMQLQQALQQAQEQIKKLSGDLQTAEREEVSSRQRVEIEKFKTHLKEQEFSSKSKKAGSIDKLTNAVKLEAEKLRLGTKANLDSQKRSEAQKAKKSQEGKE